MGLSLAWIFQVFTGVSIAQTFLITAIAFAGLSLYGYTTKRDLSAMGTFLMMGLIGLIVAMIVNIFLASSALAFAISVIGVLIFAGLTAYDTQNIKNTYIAHAQAMDQEWLGKAAIMGALNLYLDFINLFMFLLQFMGNRAKVSAEAPAATSGCASVCSKIPSSSRTWAASGSLACSASATWRASSGGTPAILVDARQRPQLLHRVRRRFSALSRAISARSVSDWLETETYSPAAIDSAPADSPAIPASSTPWRSAPDAAIPASSDATETIPSFAPSTAARSQPTRAT
jgi:hypothetical protein